MKVDSMTKLLRQKSVAEALDKFRRPEYEYEVDLANPWWASLKGDTSRAQGSGCEGASFKLCEDRGQSNWKSGACPSATSDDLQF